MQHRVRIGDRIRRVKQEVAEAVTTEFLQRHPDWVERYGDRARTHGIDDALFHQDFLAAAIEADSPQAFQDYTRWTAGMLQARGLDAAFVRENLKQIGAALGARLPDADGVVVDRFVAAGCETAVAAEGESGPTDESTGALRSVYVQALLQGARRPALAVVLDALDRGWKIGDIYGDLLQGAMYEIGRLWECNRITVAQEHAATAITQHVLAHVYERLPRPSQQRGRAIVTGVAGELHQVGANIIADALEADGWDVLFLGTNVPNAGILKALDDHDPHAVGVSATMLFNVPRVRELVGAIRTRAKPPLRIVVGGAAFRAAHSLPSELGADGYAPEVREAVRLFRSFTPGA